MIQGAIAYYRAPVMRTLLDASIRFVDGFLLPNFGPGPDKKPILSGHPEIELALIELYRTDGDKRHLELAGYILQGDDRIKLHAAPIRLSLFRHPVHFAYAPRRPCGSRHVRVLRRDGLLPGNRRCAYLKTLNTLWDDLVSAQMYVTGGVGARAPGRSVRRTLRIAEFRRPMAKVARPSAT